MRFCGNLLPYRLSTSWSQEVWGSRQLRLDVSQLAEHHKPNAPGRHSLSIRGLTRRDNRGQTTSDSVAPFFLQSGCHTTVGLFHVCFFPSFFFLFLSSLSTISFCRIWLRRIFVAPATAAGSSSSRRTWTGEPKTFWFGWSSRANKPEHRCI